MGPDLWELPGEVGSLELLDGRLARMGDRTYSLLPVFILLVKPGDSAG
jgi:hypothetical protein